MELREFVKNVLEEIFLGVKDAQESTQNTNGAINPFTKGYKEESYNIYSMKEARLVEFEVTLTHSTNNANTKGIGVFLSGVSLGAKDDKSTDNQKATKIKFAIPVVFPVYEIEEESEDL